ncbi:VIT domain-containing protein [Reichenbachiella versicolor]|uniref:VIT domain-containing protein n=1 Tax=Reichenbachiella versicolor TaxID=1821036 RepID=UPI000D6E28F2|nr:VIT domain-containing protein [Reichenbachiella versicolor]
MKIKLIILLVCMTQAVFSQNFEKAESPYVIATDSSGQKLSLPIQKVDVKATISGIIAEVTSRQVYVNDQDIPLGATYVFPGSTNAAVNAMTMTVGDRIIEAQIKEKEQAKKEFEEAVDEGKTASLFQQHRPNVFQMDLGNIPAHETVIIEIKYTELLIPVKGVYEFVYPTIVGSRYNAEIEKKEEWIVNPYANLDHPENPIVEPVFDIEVSLNAPIPLHGVSVDSHKTLIEYKSDKNATILLDNNGLSNKKDFILKYKLAGNDIQTGITLYEGDEENFFLYIGQSPKRIKKSKIPKREFFFIIDVSGSMNGFPLEVSKTLIKEILSNLNPNERFNILLFSASSSVYSQESVPATPENISDAINYIDSQNSGGGTNMLSAFKHAFSMIKDKSSTSMVILTDGYVSVEKEAFNFIESNLSKANFFPFGIGSSVNRHLIEGIAHFGQAQPFIVTNKKFAKQTAADFCEYVRSPVLTDVKVKFKELDVYDITPVQQPDLFAEKPIVVLGKWKGKANGKVKLTGHTSDNKYVNEIGISANNIDPNQQGLKYLWARNKLKYLSDYESVSGFESNKEEITALALKYSLLSEYTSFVAIDHDGTETEQNDQHTNNSGAVPEPHEWALIMIGIGLLVFMYWRSQNSTTTA